MFSVIPLLLTCFFVLLDIQTAHQEIEKCNGDMTACLQNSTNLSQFYISNALNDSSTRHIHRKNIPRVYKKRKNTNRRKNFRRKVHRYSTRVLILKPAIILLPPFENDIQERNVSTLNPFIINILANLKNSTENFDFGTSFSKHEPKSQKKYNPNVSVNGTDQNPSSLNDANVASFTERIQNPIIVPPQDTKSFPKLQQAPVNVPFSNIELQRTPSNDIGAINTPHPPFQYLLPPFVEERNNALDTQQLENPNQLNDVQARDYVETSNSFSTHQLPETSSFPTLPIGETVSMEHLNQTISYDIYSAYPGTTIQPVLGCFNNTKVANGDCFMNGDEVQESDTYNNFNNTLLAPEVASLGMKIVTSKKGLEMVKELTTSSESKSSNEHPHYDGSHGSLETAESGDIRLHTFNQILSVDDAKDISKDMYKALKKPNKPFEICHTNQGYVADPSSGCQVFYICLGTGAGELMMCPNGTLFNQEVLVCDWWYNVECSG